MFCYDCRELVGWEGSNSIIFAEIIGGFWSIGRFTSWFWAKRKVPRRYRRGTFKLWIDQTLVLSYSQGDGEGWHVCSRAFSSSLSWPFLTNREVRNICGCIPRSHAPNERFTTMHILFWFHPVTLPLIRTSVLFIEASIAHRFLVVNCRLYQFICCFFYIPFIP